MIKDPNFEVTSVITDAFAANGIEIVLEVCSILSLLSSFTSLLLSTIQVRVPPVPSPLVDYSTLRPMDDDAAKIFAAGTKIIYTATFVPSLYYLLHEAIRYEVVMW